MNMIRRNGRFDKPASAGSLAAIEQEIADVLDAVDRIQEATEDAGGHIQTDHGQASTPSPLWQLAEAVKGIAWAVGSLAQHHEDLAVDAKAKKESRDLTP